MNAAPERITGRERLLVFLLMSVQLSQMLDFMIIPPLGPQLMRVLGASPRQFGMLTTVYAVSAAVAGIAASFFADRVDRRKLLLAVYAVFLATALLGALATTYEDLLAVRAVAGVAGGIITGTLVAIISDVIPEARRGRALGTLMASFSMAMIVGVPVNLALANRFDWHAPFWVTVAVACVLLPACAVLVPAVRGHVSAARRSAVLDQMRSLLRNPNHLRALALLPVMACSGFMISTFLPPYLVGNVGVAEADLAVCFLFGGLAALVGSQVAGRLCDRLGRYTVFKGMMAGAMIGALVATNFPPAPLWAVIVLQVTHFMFFSSRQVPAMAIVAAGVESRSRGGLLSLASSLQQLGMAFAAGLASVVLGWGPGGELTGYWVLGLVSVAIGCVALWLGLGVRAAESPPGNAPA